MAIYDLTISIPAKDDLRPGDKLNCPYSGAAVSYTLPEGVFKLEVWGGQGGYRSSKSNGGYGGDSVGTLTLTEEVKVWLYAGGSGNTGSTSGGFNGGGRRASYPGGGGGSDVRIAEDSLFARVLVAGGGGAEGASGKTGGYGGGTTGGPGTSSYGTGSQYYGTQTGVAGNSSWIKDEPTTGTTSERDVYAGFGFGGNGYNGNSGYGGAGGGGWYGGCGSTTDGSGDDDSGGAGGSGYIYTAETAADYPAGCLLDERYYLSTANTAAGNTSFTAPDGSAETGHKGDGYVRITVIKSNAVGEPDHFLVNGLVPDRVRMEWSASEKATGYRVYRDGELLTDTTDLSYETAAVVGERHVYGVLAYNEKGESETVEMPYTLYYEPPEPLTKAPTVYGISRGLSSLSMRWKPVRGADGYRVYRDGEIVQTGTERSFRLEGLSDGERPALLVAAFNGEGTGPFTFVWSAPREAIISARWLITDRTQADVDRVKELCQKGWPAMTAEERMEYLHGMEEVDVFFRDETPFETTDGPAQTGGIWFSDLEPMTLQDGVATLYGGEVSNKGAYNESDLNRVELAVQHLAEVLRQFPVQLKEYANSFGVAWDRMFDVPYNPADFNNLVGGDWNTETIPQQSDLERYLSNVRKLREAMVYETGDLPGSMDKLTWQGANAIERALVLLLQAVKDYPSKDYIDGVYRSIRHLNAPGFYAGQEPLPTSGAARARTWAELDAMNTTWRNWQAANWIGLVYGDLKAEADVNGS